MISKTIILGTIIAGMLIAVTALTTSSTNFAEAKGTNNDVVMLQCVSSLNQNNSFVRLIIASDGAQADIAGIPRTTSDAQQNNDTPPFTSNCAQALADLKNVGFVIADSESVINVFGPDTDDDGDPNFIGSSQQMIYTLVRQGHN